MLILGSSSYLLEISNGIYLLLSHWLIIFQSIVLQADWLILDNNEKGTIHINMHYQGELRFFLLGYVMMRIEPTRISALPWMIWWKKRFPNAIFNCNSKEYSVIINNPFFDWQRKPGNFELVHYGMSSIAIIEVWSYHLLLCWQVDVSVKSKDVKTGEREITWRIVRREEDTTWTTRGQSLMK